VSEDQNNLAVGCEDGILRLFSLEGGVGSIVFKANFLKQPSLFISYFG
jgi:hypothetical protein